VTTLITGSAGFIGFNLAKRLLERGEKVIGLDNLNSYYDVSLKEARLAEIHSIAKTTKTSFSFVKGDLEDSSGIDRLFETYKPTKVVNLAAQAGVRYSIDNPAAYIQSNLVGFGIILQACRKFKVQHLVYASSSSVYGGNTKMPFSEKHAVDHPISLYAASKKANELMAHTYSHLYSLPTTGLRFFTVYGPWGRPDMALFLFTKAIISGEPIKIFNYGKMTRDFTYIDDIIEGVIRVIDKIATPDPSFDSSKPNPSISSCPYRIFNIGNSSPASLLDYITSIEENLGIKAKKELLPIQPGDVPATHADTSALEDWINFKPTTEINQGVSKFISWYKQFYNI
tara:strand:- start:6 stop:1028 length:1023 start_codon:yes stop_codon:yes gene_type:complete